MNVYETIFIVEPDLEEDKIKELIQKFSSIIESDGKISKVNEWGKQKLAYEVKKQKEGYYILIEFEANSSLISELERVYNVTDEVIKYIVTKK